MEKKPDERLPADSGVFFNCFPIEPGKGSAAYPEGTSVAAEQMRKVMEDAGAGEFFVSESNYDFPTTSYESFPIHPGFTTSEIAEVLQLLESGQLDGQVIGTSFPAKSD
ncbi:MAG: hypothetical protein ACK4FB_08215 [Brevundimonas sp.]|uniref:hypothetical protein n=1 Tax=Brevundimonas sp. TaxID=1871086 RepID=UPI003919C9A2